jgi:hypothetical protein
MTVGQVTRYLQEYHHRELTRQTVYNWMKVGVRGEVLESMQAIRQKWAATPVRVTTKEWLHDFFRRIGQPLSVDQSA